MSQPRKPAPEPGIRELLNDEIGRAVMRADGVERREVLALAARVGPSRAKPEVPVRKPERSP